MATYDMEEGVFYRCQRCTNCCEWPGEVVVSDAEIQRMAEHLGLSVYRFIAEFTELRRNRSGLTLAEKEGGHTCVLLEGRECRVHPVKPDQCARFPNGWNFPGWRARCEALPEREEAVPENKTGASG